MALLGREHLTDVFARGMGGEGPQPGRMGDYVFNQEALDQIITQLMESSNNSRPVPATEEIMEKLPREVLEIGSSTLEKDCAVCKDQFKLDTEDPDEQVVVTLPCHHPFHEPCIMPWLKSSGTCPVCRHALIPQPEHHGPPPSGDNSNARPPPPPTGGPGALFESLFGSMGGRNPPSGSGGGQRGGAGGSSRPRSNSDTTGHHFPGGWDEELD
jgi:E3 ubiquitin-protein ligase RNF115/126